jgi:hypothetical protein
MGCAAALLATGCGDDGDDVAGGGSEPPARRIAVDASSLRPAGTEIVPGVEVQPGSSLVVGAFPMVDFYPRSPDIPNELGWQAVVVVEGEPVEVWDRYAEAMDIADTGSAVSSCVVARAERLVELGTTPVEEERFLTEDRIEGENRMTCLAHTSGGTTMSMAIGVSREACVSERVEDCVVRPTSHLLLQKRTTTESSRYPEQDRLGTDQLRFERGAPQSEAEGLSQRVAIPDGDPIPPRLDDPIPGSRLPAEGEPFDDGLDYYLAGSEANSVPDGGSSLVAPAKLIDCNSGLVAILRVPLGIKDSLTYFDEADDHDDPMATVQIGTDAAGRDWAGGEITTAGGYYLDVLAVQDGKDREDSSIVLLTECGD